MTAAAACVCSVTRQTQAVAVAATSPEQHIMATLITA